MTVKEFFIKENKELEKYYDEYYDIFDFSFKKLISLEGLPKDFNTELWLHDNNLQNLKGLPKDFNNFIDLKNNKLKNLEGLPEKFKSEIYLYDNPIESLDGLNDILNPKNIYGLDKDFIISEYKRLGKHHLLI